MADIATPGSPLTFSKLLIASLIVAPVASCGGSLIVAGGSVATAGDGIDDAGMAVFAVVFILVVATIVSFLFVAAALWLLALPLTLILARFEIGRLIRDLILLAVAAGAGALLWPTSAFMYEGQGWILPSYTLALAVLWVIALHLIERRNRISREGAHG